MNAEGDHVELVMIRHAESEYNLKAELLRKELNLGTTWEQQKSSPQFMEFKYSYELMDCSLSQKGLQQCQALRQSQQLQAIIDADLVLVSPLYRALKTCSIIVGNTELEQKVIVDPILSQSLRCACDVSFNLPKAKEEFKNFDFSSIGGKEGKWYIENQQPQKRQVYQQILAQRNATGYEERAKEMTKYMGQTYNFEDSADLIKRMQQAKQKIRQYAINYKAKKIIIVSHFYSIMYMTSTVFDDRNKPVPYPFIANAQPNRYLMNLGISPSDPAFISPVK